MGGDKVVVWTNAEGVICAEVFKGSSADADAYQRAEYLHKQHGYEVRLGHVNMTWLAQSKG